MGGDQRQVHVPALLDRFAAIHGFEHRQFPGFFLDDACDAINIFATLAAGHFAPDARIGTTRGPDGGVHVAFIGGGDFAELLFRRRIERVEILARTRRDELAVDEQIVARRNFDVIKSLGRGRIIPPVAERQPPLSERNHGSHRVCCLVETGPRRNPPPLLG